MGVTERVDKTERVGYVAGALGAKRNSLPTIHNPYPSIARWALKGAEPQSRREAASGFAAERERRHGGTGPRRDADGSEARCWGGVEGSEPRGVDAETSRVFASR